MLEEIFEDIKKTWVNIIAIILYVLLTATFPAWIIPYTVYKKIKSVALLKGGASDE